MGVRCIAKRVNSGGMPSVVVVSARRLSLLVVAVEPTGHVPRHTAAKFNEVGSSVVDTSCSATDNIDTCNRKSSSSSKTSKIDRLLF